jgi:hypothetical protein
MRAPGARPLAVRQSGGRRRRVLHLFFLKAPSSIGDTTKRHPAAVGMAAIGTLSARRRWPDAVPRLLIRPTSEATVSFDRTGIAGRLRRGDRDVGGHAHMVGERAGTRQPDLWTAGRDRGSSLAIIGSMRGSWKAADGRRPRARPIDGSGITRPDSSKQPSAADVRCLPSKRGITARAEVVRPPATPTASSWTSLSARRSSDSVSCSTPCASTRLARTFLG